MSCTTVLHLALVSVLVSVTVILLQWCRENILSIVLYLVPVTGPSDCTTQFISCAQSSDRKVSKLVNQLVLLQLTSVSDDGYLLISPQYFRFLDRYCELSQGKFLTPRFLFMMSLCPTFCQPVLRDPPSSWECSTCFNILHSLSLFQCPAHPCLSSAIISYIKIT